MAHLFWLICSSPIVGILYIHIQYLHTSGMSRFLAKRGKMLGGGCERLVSYWPSCASVYGQSDTSAVGFTQFAGCQMRLIVLPSAGHSFFSSVSGRETNAALSVCVRLNWPPSSDVVPSHRRCAQTPIPRHRRCEWSSRETAVSRLPRII